MSMIPELPKIRDLIVSRGERLGERPTESRVADGSRVGWSRTGYHIGLPAESVWTISTSSVGTTVSTYPDRSGG